jgi:hypothetical protein
MDAKRAVEIAQTESEATRDEPIPEGVKGERRGRSVVQSVRLPAEDFAEIERIAAEAGVPVSALIRGWVLAGLAAERSTSLRGAIEHLAAEAERLRRLAAVSRRGLSAPGEPGAMAAAETLVATRTGGSPPAPSPPEVDLCGAVPRTYAAEAGYGCGGRSRSWTVVIRCQLEKQLVEKLIRQNFFVIVKNGSLWGSFLLQRSIDARE